MRDESYKTKSPMCHLLNSKDLIVLLGLPRQQL